MARFNEIQVGRYNRYLQKLLSMKGEVPAPQLAAEISTHFALFNGAENRYLEQWDLFGAALNIGGAALNQSAVRLRNPSGSNVLACFTKISATVGAASNVLMYNGVTTTDLATVTSIAKSRFDARSRPSPTLIASIQNTAVTAPTLDNLAVQNPAPTTGFLEIIAYECQEIPLLPGDAIELVAQTVNVSIFGSFFWRERFLEDSERA